MTASDCESLAVKIMRVPSSAFRHNHKPILLFRTGGSFLSRPLLTRSTSHLTSVFVGRVSLPVGDGTRIFLTSVASHLSNE